MSSTSNLRKRLDALIQNGKTIKRSAETTLAWRSLQMAKAWLGKALGYQGNASPYPAEEKLDGTTIVSDVATEAFPLSDDHLANVNAMRDAIQSEIESIEGLLPTEERQRHCYQKSLDHLTEARMWYGFELQELREKALNPPAPQPDINTLMSDRRVDLAWNEDGSGVNVVDTPIGKYMTCTDPYDVGKEAVAGAKFDGNTGTDYVIKEKISENESKGSKKEQQGTSGKKG